jgi:hypothetical protein
VRHASAEEVMYVGIGTIVAILIIVLLLVWLL